MDECKPLIPGAANLNVDGVTVATCGGGFPFKTCCEAGEVGQCWLTLA